MVSEDTQALAVRLQEMEARDEAQVLAKLTGQMVDEYVYKFKDSRNREQKGLSIAGIEEWANEQGNIHVRISSIEDHGSYWRVMAIAEDRVTNTSFESGVHQPKIGARSGGQGTYEIGHAFEIAQSKAIRNAIKRLMPKSVEIKAIAALEARAGGQQSTKAQQQKRPAQKPPKQSVKVERAEEQPEPETATPQGNSPSTMPLEMSEFENNGDLVAYANKTLSMTGMEVLAAAEVDTYGDLDVNDTAMLERIWAARPRQRESD
jgi:hypothetical protein